MSFTVVGIILFLKEDEGLKEKIQRGVTLLTPFDIHADFFLAEAGLGHDALVSLAAPALGVHGGTGYANSKMLLLPLVFQPLENPPHLTYHRSITEKRASAPDRSSNY